MNTIAQIEAVEPVETDVAGDNATVELDELELAVVGGGTGDVCFRC